MQPAPKRGALPTAVWALRNGLWPVTITPRGKAPIGPAWGVRTPTRDALRRSYEDHPGAGVGLALGPAAGIVDVEVDDPERAAETLAGVDLPGTLGWTSARGSHRLYRWTPRLDDLGPSAVVHLDGVEIRKGAAGKQLVSVCPPAVGDDRRRRRWHGGWEVLPFPEALLRKAAGASERPAHLRPPTTPPKLTTDRYAAAALRAEAEGVAGAVEGTRNRTLNRAAFKLGQLVAAGLLDRRRVEVELFEAASSAGLGEREVRATLKSGLDAGEARPRG